MKSSSPRMGNGSPSAWAMNWRQDVSALLYLAGLAGLFVGLSWRKWPDPLIDFGRELYLPWRLSQGAVLYRDVDNFYGPLSQYLNAVLFRICGPGVMVLVWANLVVYAAILAALYVLLRRAWGFRAALVACTVFVAVFSFSQLVPASCFNYAAPYAHETTHGFLVCLLLVLAWLRWLERPTKLSAFMAGGLLGLTTVLKPEILFAAGLVTIAGSVLHWRRQGRCLPTGGWWWLLGAVLPTALFAAYFARFQPVAEAVRAACRAWLSVTASTAYTGDAVQRGFLGFDEPWLHLQEHLRMVAEAVVLLGLIAGVLSMMKPGMPRWIRILAGMVAVVFPAWMGCCIISWLDAGRCFLGLIIAYLLIHGVCIVRDSSPNEGNFQRKALRLLLTVLAAALMARMVLNGRISQFGYYQAALAGVMIPAILLGELPAWLRLQGRAKGMALAAIIALIAPGIWRVAMESHQYLRLKTQAIGEGRDRFYTYPARKFPECDYVRRISDVLRTESPNQKLLVLPEGLMINYLSRKPSPLAPFFFFSAATRDGREEQLVHQLDRTPPDWVVIISRDLREYGLKRYGETPGSGRLLLDWVTQHYDVVASMGNDPLDYQNPGAAVLRRKPALAP